MDREPVPAADLVDHGFGLAPAGEGWFVVNVGEAQGRGLNADAYDFRFESPENHFPHFGVNVSVIAPGERSAMYHAESGQEAFLVLSGECTLVIEEEVRTLRQWDFVHCPPNTAHVIVGAGSGPCAVLMMGARNAGDEIVYPRSEAAAAFGASAAQTTSEPGEAYTGWPEMHPGRFPWPPE